jgi:SAM-dependent methyltransferase
MRNPWLDIGLDAYEAHMRTDGVRQLQALGEITAEQLECGCGRVVILGAAAGNGLERIGAAAAVEKVYAVDINAEYLAACRERFACLGGKLETLCRDLSRGSSALPACDVMVCNLIIEYIGIPRFVEIARANRGSAGVISCVIQRNNGASFVSASPTARKLKSLGPLHRDIDEKELVSAMGKAGFAISLRKAYSLPNGKEFVRMDFVKG